MLKATKNRYNHWPFDILRYDAYIPLIILLNRKNLKTCSNKWSTITSSKNMYNKNTTDLADEKASKWYCAASVNSRIGYSMSLVNKHATNIG